MEIDRRHILLGAGMALTLVGCKDEQSGNGSGEANGATGLPQPHDPHCLRPDWHTYKGMESDWNYGDAPWESFDQEAHDEPGPPTATFTADYIAVLHLEVLTNPFSLVGWRAHFPIDKGQPNTRQGIMPRVIDAIQFLNTLKVAAPLPTLPGFLTAPNLKSGIKGFGFTRPHHFIIYIKNKGITYDPDFPIWFKGKLIDPWQGPTDTAPTYDAAPNRSFFEAKPPGTEAKIPVNGESDQFLYIKNYFYTADPGTDERLPKNRRKITTEKIKYGLNINTTFQSLDGLTIPLIFDPDTGNMGGGGDGALP